MLAISTTTAPASTMMTINQYKARGDFVYTLLQVVALDDLVCLILFSIASAAISAQADGNLTAMEVFLPIIYNIIFIIVGFFSGILLERLLLPEIRSESNRFILVISLLLAITGVCSIFNISPLLACMVFGATYINTTEDLNLYNEINHFTPPILSLFFVLSGINLDMGSMYTLGITGVACFVIRIIGKYIGAYGGSLVAKKDASIKRYLGLALIPQAGVSIGLAFLGQRMLPGEVGNKLMTIILSSAVLYELIGPVSAKFALFKSGAIDSESGFRT